jgi:hypothetical protein
METSVMAISVAKNNADLMVECADLGYLDESHITVDPTYGLGRFWTKFRPTTLLASDLDPERSPIGRSVDFRQLPYADRSVDRVVFDPPYKLNGTGGSHASDEAYGVATAGVRWQDKMQLCRDGITEAERILKQGGMLLVKCQDQVCSGKVRWQTIDFTNHAASLGFRLFGKG